MKIDRPDRIAEMEVCCDCIDVVGPVWRLLGPRAGEGPLRQRGRCPAHPARLHAPLWPGFDYNRVVDLCRCCGVEPRASGSKWSVWFCDPCKEEVGLLNERHGRCIVPIGRHSVHWGALLRVEEAENPFSVQGFLDASKAMVTASGVLADWHQVAVALNLIDIGAVDAAALPILDYWHEADARVDRRDRFREMCAYMDRRGRAMIGSPEKGACT
jgi:hypothetical protein